MEKGKGKKRKIYLRIYVNRIKAEIATSYSLAPEDWDEDSQRCKKATHINKELSAMEAKIYQLQSLLDYENRPVTARILKDLYLEKDKLHVDLVEYYKRYMDVVESDVSLSKETISTYYQTFNYIGKFVKHNYNIKDILIRQVDFKFIINFNAYLQTNQLTKNTINKHHSRFRTLLIRAIKEGHIIKNPYVDYKLKNEKSKRVALTKEELLALEKHNLGGNESLKKVRDIFIFSVYTGLRYQDAQNLEVKHLTKTASGRLLIDILQQKTNEPVGIPLLEPAKNIYMRYDDEERKITKKVLPRISNQKLNAYLKVIAELTGINRKLTSHVARHTCATTVLLSNGVSLKVVSKWLGHTSVKQTEDYAKVNVDYLEEIANDVEKKI